jgi:hypothetical protein
MATTAADKAAYNEKIKTIKDGLTLVGKTILTQRNELAKVSIGISAPQFKAKYALAAKILAEVSLQIIGSRLSQKFINIKNENYLDDARKNFYAFCALIEEMVGDDVEAIDERREALDILEEISSNTVRMELFKKAGFLLEKLERIYGESSKWKWSFVEIQGRLVNALKNNTNFKTLQRDLDPSIEGYPERMELLNLIQKNFERTADRFRNKYELKGKAIDDMKDALAFVSFIKKLASVTGDQETVSNCKRKIDTWTKKLNEDHAKEEAKLVKK